jgi:hypothetical protein
VVSAPTISEADGGSGRCGSERRGGVGWASGEAAARWGGGEWAGWGERRWPRLGQKLELG